jgi:hypothetical protein
MYGLKVGWIIPVIVLSALLVVIGVGIYQINLNENPWCFGESNTDAGWEFLKNSSYNDSAIIDPVERQ